MTGRAVLFDMDGTLVDSEPAHHRAWVDVFAEYQLELPEGFETGFTGASAQAVYGQIVELTGLTASYEAVALSKSRAFLRRRAELAARRGAMEAIATLRKLGVQMAIVSNSDRMLVDATLNAVNLAWPGLVSVSRNDVRQGKPDPESYLRAAWLLGMSPADCIVVEDSPIGATAGVAAGMTVIGWPDPHSTDLIFPDGTLFADPYDLMSTLMDLLL